MAAVYNRPSVCGCARGSYCYKGKYLSKSSNSPLVTPIFYIRIGFRAKFRFRGSISELITTGGSSARRGLFLCFFLLRRSSLSLEGKQFRLESIGSAAGVGRTDCRLSRARELAYAARARPSAPQLQQTLLTGRRPRVCSSRLAAGLLVATSCVQLWRCMKQRCCRWLRPAPGEAAGALRPSLALCTRCAAPSRRHQSQLWLHTEIRVACAVHAEDELTAVVYGGSRV